MKYLHLTAIGDSQKDEEGTPGLRIATLDNVANRLRTALLRRDMLLNMLEGKSGTAKSGSPATSTKSTAKPTRIYDDDAVPIVPTASKTVTAPVTKGGTWKSASPSASASGQKMNVPPRVQLATPRRSLLMAKLKEAEERVRYERLLLERQGCVLKPDGTIDWTQSLRQVEYDHDLAKQGMSQVTIKNGLLHLGSVLLDTKSMVTQFSGPGFAIYVMSATGNIHVSSHSVGHRHHSSLLAGKSVAGAGELKCTKGRLERLSNKSGHYKPNVLHLAQVVHQLLKNGIPTVFSVKVLPEGRIYSTAKAFLSQLAPEEDYDLAKLRRYHHYLKDEILAEHQPDPWRTFDPETEELGVFSAVTGQMIPHKQVRQWLKSCGKFATQATQSGSGR